MSVFLNDFITTVYMGEVCERIFKNRTALGSDGIDNLHFKANIDENILSIQEDIQNNTYKFNRYKEKLVLKSNKDRPRIISIPTTRDRLVLRLLNDYLVKIFNEQASIHARDHISSIENILNGSPPKYMFIKYDIKSFYPNVNHKLLTSILIENNICPNAIHLIRNAIKTQTGKAKERNNTGVPQGLSISNILSSVYLKKFDKTIINKVSTYKRYVDDILIITKPVELKAINDLIVTQLMNLKLKQNKGKYLETTIDKSVNYLGFKLSKSGIQVKNQSLEKIYTRIINLIKLAKTNPNFKGLNYKLDLKITGCIWDGKRFGWMHYFASINKLNQLKALDNFVQKEITKHFPDKSINTKKFIKTYHEIRHNFNQTQYIPIFDGLNRLEKISKLVEFYNWEYDELARDTNAEINYKFNIMMQEIVKELEKDTMGIKYYNN